MFLLSLGEWLWQDKSEVTFVNWNNQDDEQYDNKEAFWNKCIYMSTKTGFWFPEYCQYYSSKSFICKINKSEPYYDFYHNIRLKILFVYWIDIKSESPNLSGFADQPGGGRVPCEQRASVCVCIASFVSAAHANGTCEPKRLSAAYTRRDAHWQVCLLTTSEPQFQTAQSLVVGTFALNYSFLKYSCPSIPWNYSYHVIICSLFKYIQGYLKSFLDEQVFLTTYFKRCHLDLLLSFVGIINFLISFLIFLDC